jgi:hypothetical protein
MPEWLQPYTHFGIIDCLDKNKNYASDDFRQGLEFSECLLKYHCVWISDDIINDWWERLTKMKTYFQFYSNPNTALDRWGVTLIPPESLELFIEIINDCTSAEFREQCPEDIERLLSLLSAARRENKFVIHYGI